MITEQEILQYLNQALEDVIGVPANMIDPETGLADFAGITTVGGIARHHHKRLTS